MIEVVLLANLLTQRIMSKMIVGSSGTIDSDPIERASCSSFRNTSHLFHHHELLLNPEIDAVCVVTPRQYRTYCIDCLKAKKHVCRKSLAGKLQTS